MTAKQKVLEHAPRWSEEQAERALRAAEGSRPEEPNRRADALRRAAALRARQSETVDAAVLVREGRDELERRTF
ncbi:MAG: hypothetical protein WD810_06425 [Solirubrobacterales bacterium]